MLSAELFARDPRAASAHARHVERYLSCYFSPNTHLTGEALGLFYAGLCSPSLPTRALARLGTRDSGRASSSGRCCRRRPLRAVDLLPPLHGRNLSALRCCSRRGTACRCRAEIAERHRAHDRLPAGAREPDGSMPAIGDADGGSLLPLAPGRRGDSRGVFAVAAARVPAAGLRVGRAGRRAGGALAAAAPRRSRRSRRCAPRPPDDGGSRCLPAGGYAVMRSGWERRAHQLISMRVRWAARSAAVTVMPIS